MQTNLTFSVALSEAKRGKLISREGWNGKGMFVFVVKEANFPLVALLGNEYTPKAVKDYFESKHEPITSKKSPTVTCAAYFCMKSVDDTLVNGWVPSQTDMLASDWCVKS